MKYAIFVIAAFFLYSSFYMEKPEENGDIQHSDTLLGAVEKTLNGESRKELREKFEEFKSKRDEILEEASRLTKDGFEEIETEEVLLELQKALKEVGIDPNEIIEKIKKVQQKGTNGNSEEMRGYGQDPSEDMEE